MFEESVGRTELEESVQVVLELEVAPGEFAASAETEAVGVAQLYVPEAESEGGVVGVEGSVMLSVPGAEFEGLGGVVEAEGSAKPPVPVAEGLEEDEENVKVTVEE